MITLLFTSILILGVLVLAVYLWQKAASTPEVNELPPTPELRGLFTEPEKPAQIETKLDDEQVRPELIALANAGDKSVLQKARELNDAQLYDELLTALVASTTSDAQLFSLTSFVT